MPFEIEIIKWLQTFSSPTMDIVTAFASFLFDYTIVIVVFLLFCFANKKIYGFYFLLVQGAALVVQKFLKSLINRPRPYLADQLIRGIFLAEDSSFPSGHSITAMGVFLFVIYLVYKSNLCKKDKQIITTFGILYLILNCLNRMYLGQHYLTDCLAGYLCMFLICCLALVLYKKYLKFAINMTSLIKNKIFNKNRGEKIEKKETNNN